MEPVAQVLAEHGPLDEDALRGRLRDAGVVDPDAAVEDLLDETDCPAGMLVGDRWVWLPTLLAGRVFTHRLDATELAHDILAVTPDLDPITAMCEYEQYGRFADGSEAEVVLPGYDEELLEQRGIPAEVIAPSGALLLAPGTLAALGVAKGDLIGVRQTDQGLTVEQVTAHPHATVGARLAATVTDEPVLIDAAVWTVCVEDPTAFTEPLPPLCEIVADAGLAQHGDWLAPGGFDFNGWHFEQGCATLAEVHDLDTDDAVALYTLIKLYEQISMVLDVADAGELAEDALPGEDGTGPDDSPDLFGEFGAALADPLLAELLVSETIDRDDGAAALSLFTEVLEPKVPRAAKVACRWLRAVALERIGDIDAAERELLAAEGMDPDWPLPLLGLARIASDRGDAERGLALLHRAGAEPDYPVVELLERHRVAPRSDVGRNELCWCGSGRKYKKCHLGQEQLLLSERADWLYAKAVQHALQSDWAEVRTEVGYERCRDDDDDDLDALLAASDDPLVLDAVLFEGGAFAEFLEIRGSLLPDDERQLAEQWLTVERSVFEIEQVQPGKGVTVRDLRTGDTQEVLDRAAGGQLKPGQLICAHVLPVGDDMQFFGGVEPVAPQERDALIKLLDSEPDPVALVAQLSR